MQDIPETELIEKTDSIDWSDWAPVWTTRYRKNAPQSSKITPHDFQESHSPSRAAGKDTTRRRILDAKLWEALSLSRQDAAIAIERAYQLLSKGLGFRISAPHLERVSGTRRFEEQGHHTVMTGFYLDWAKACPRSDISHAACIDIIVFGKSCRTIDKDRARRKGWARNNLNEGLDLYCRMKGWPVG